MEWFDCVNNLEFEILSSRSYYKDNIFILIISYMALFNAGI